MNPIPINKIKFLAVEGKDEENFFAALLQKISIPDVQIFNYEGKTNLSDFLDIVPNVTGFSMIRKFAIIRDTDNENQLTVFNSICSKLKSNNFPVPSTLNSFSVSSEMYIGIYLMPAINKYGMLEDVCLESISDEPVLDCINNFVKCANITHIHLSKAKTFMYLATKDTLPKSLGVAAQQGHWNFNHKAFDDIKKFLTIFS